MVTVPRDLLAKISMLPPSSPGLSNTSSSYKAAALWGSLQPDRRTVVLDVPVQHLPHSLATATQEAARDSIGAEREAEDLPAASMPIGFTSRNNQVQCCTA